VRSSKGTHSTLPLAPCLGQVASVDKEGLIRFVVNGEQGPDRLDRLVAHGGGVSRKQARLWIRQGCVRVGGKVLKVLSREIRAGKVVEVRMPDGSDSAQAQPKSLPPLSIVHLDSQWVIVNKASGLLSEPDRTGSPSLLTFLPRLLAERGEKDKVWLVHRLDAQTSGVMVVARTRHAAKTLGEAFRSGQVKKDYLAICCGDFKRSQEVNAPIGKGQTRRWAVVKEGKPSATHLRRLAGGGGFSLVQAKPRTGRTHQIRVHLEHVGHPIAGDGLYGGHRYTEDLNPVPIFRVMLHAWKLSLPHPSKGQLSHWSVAPPQDFMQFANRLAIDMHAFSDDKV
jgi:23S rRNA pseudouridine1911/1915/1917 synthase